MDHCRLKVTITPINSPKRLLPTSSSSSSPSASVNLTPSQSFSDAKLPQSLVLFHADPLVHANSSRSITRASAEVSESNNIVITSEFKWYSKICDERKEFFIWEGTIIRLYLVDAPWMTDLDPVTSKIKRKIIHERLAYETFRLY